MNIDKKQQYFYVDESRNAGIELGF